MKFDVVFVDVDEVLAAHSRVLAKDGGQDGVRDRGLLESAVMAPRTGYYNSLAELAAVYTHGIVKNHPFLDGNKRTGLTIGGAFLKTNGFPRLKLGNEWIRHIERLAAGELSRDELTALFTAAMGGDPVALE
ncbi:MAG: type II toxin-antitoxin system death-on-curing family toxin [Labilithrix sp.]|nr:type II toxin-antitoxin system death-on-curing family toxin [Labilithrix sp.]MCW5811372.1 type II toxin-antitoxin system death-on-curing family toxin [Labilithrix sp.]